MFDSSSNILLLLVLLAIASMGAALAPEKQAGIVKWSAWPNKPKADGVSVTIEKGQIILLDESPVKLVGKY
jgi:hypothetical protein